VSGFDVPPLRGLPGALPSGERLLWQGAPQLRAMALRVFHVRKVAIYFALLVFYRVIAALHDGTPLRELARPTLVLAALAGVACAILFGIAWLVCRTTVYSITSRRVILHIGVALPITFNLPFAVLGAAAVKLHRDGTGTIPLELTEGNRLSYVVLWPHARPWRNAKAEPSLRLIPDAARVARLLADAVAAAMPDRVAVGAPMTVPAAVSAAPPLTPVTVAS
jgi:hypothetical protein